MIELRILLHSCCAPCLAGSRIPYEEEGFEVIGYWYNPNIHPWKEYDRRLQDMERYSLLEPMKIIYDKDYPLLEIIEEMTLPISNKKENRSNTFMDEKDRSKRCESCYKRRIKNTAMKAKEMKIDGFSTTLLISKYQNHDLIKEVCTTTAKEVGVEFIYRDLRKYWGRSLDKSRKYRLYRQQYCGCIFSESERYQKEIDSPYGMNNIEAL